MKRRQIKNTFWKHTFLFLDFSRYRWVGLHPRPICRLFSPFLPIFTYPSFYLILCCQISFAPFFLLSLFLCCFSDLTQQIPPFLPSLLPLHLPVLLPIVPSHLTLQLGPISGGEIPAASLALTVSSLLCEVAFAQRTH